MCDLKTVSLGTFENLFQIHKGVITRTEEVAIEAKYIYHARVDGQETLFGTASDADGDYVVNMRFLH